MSYKQVSDIRARVTTEWNHHRCKFLPGDTAQVSDRVLPMTFRGREIPHHTSRPQRAQAGRYGTVVAVSCYRDGKIRSSNNKRQFTRYYLQFATGEIQGFESHHLDHGMICKWSVALVNKPHDNRRIINQPHHNNNMYTVLKNNTPVINADDIETAVRFVQSMERALDRSIEHSPYTIVKNYYKWICYTSPVASHWHSSWDASWQSAQSI